MTFGCLQNQAKPILKREKSPNKRIARCPAHNEENEKSQGEEDEDKPVLAITSRTNDPEDTKELSEAAATLRKEQELKRDAEQLL